MGAYTQRAEELQDQRWANKDAQKKENLAPLTQALQASQTRLALFADPNDPTKPVAGKESEYSAAHDQVADIIGKMRTVLHPPPPEDPHGLSYLGARALDKLHITRHLAAEARANQSAKVNKYYQQGADQVQATVEGAQPYQNTSAGQAESQRLADSLKEIEARNAAAGWTKNGNPVQVQVDGKPKWMQPFTNKAGETKMEPMPDGYSGPYQKPNTSMYAGQKASFARSIGKTPETMDWKDEQAFLAQRYNASQPLANRKLALSEDRLHIDQQALQLRYAQNNWKDTMDLMKSMGPTDKLQATAKVADEYVDDPTGPGDVALTLAFFEAAKAADPASGSGIRFTQQENNLIQGARGLADAAQAKIGQGYQGTLYDDDQRQQMAEIIKATAKEATQQQGELLNAASSLNPTAATTAASAAGAPPPLGPKTQQLQAQRGKGGEYIYAKDPQGKLHRAKKGTALPQGWTLSNGPS